jgi:hypothetical protein
MPTKGSTLPERIARWKVIHTNLTPALPELPHLAGLHGELGKVIAESEEMDGRSESLKAETREVNRKKEGLGKTGDDLRNRLGAALRTVHGFDSEKLLEFGLQPRRTRGRDRKARARRTPATTPAPTTPPDGGSQTTT